MRQDIVFFMTGKNNVDNFHFVDFLMAFVIEKSYFLECYIIIKSEN